MSKIIHLLLLFVIAGLTHIGSTLLYPRFAREDVFSRLIKDAPTNSLHLLDAKTIAGLRFFDPSIAAAICRFDLIEGPVRIRTRLSDTFLTIVLADPKRGIFSSVSDRAATAGMLDVVIATQKQLDRISAMETEAEAIDEIRIPAPHAQGLAILKIVVDHPSARETAEAVLSEARCEAEALPN